MASGYAHVAVIEKKTVEQSLTSSAST